MASRISSAERTALAAFLPAKVLTDLEAHCAAFHDNVVDVVADAVVMHLEEMERRANEALLTELCGLPAAAAGGVS